MKPEAVEGSAGKFIIVQKCEKCWHVRKQKMAANDSPDALIAVAKARKITPRS